MAKRIIWPFTLFSLLLPRLICAQQAGLPPDFDRVPCEDVVRAAFEAVASLHWNPEVRAAARVSARRRQTLCGGSATVDEALRRALAALDDPAIRSLEPAHFERTMVEWNGAARVGVGLLEVLSIDTDEATRRLTVIAPVPGSAAARAGLRARDVVTTIDGAATDSLGLSRAIQRLRVAAGESVRLTVLRADETREVVLTAERLPAIEGLRFQRRVVDGLDVLVVGLVQFTPGVAEALRAKMTTVDGIDAVVIDLRDNPGGLVDELVKAAAVFLPDGSKLADVEAQSPATLRTQETPRAPDVPVAVLVGPGTASAAEVLAGALRSHGGARIYGERTFGKGLVHRALPLLDGRRVLLLPVGRLRMADGRRVLNEGIDPDVRTVNPLEQALRDLRDRM